MIFFSFSFGYLTYLHFSFIFFSRRLTRLRRNSSAPDLLSALKSSFDLDDVSLSSSCASALSFPKKIMS